MAKFHVNNLSENCYLSIKRAMEEMRELPGSTLIIEPGEYIITTPRSKEIQTSVISGAYTKNTQPIMFSEKFVYDRLFDFDGHINTSVEAYGAKFIIDGYMETVSFRNCKGCTFRGGEFDHTRRPYSRGIITSRNGNTVIAKFTEEYAVNNNIPHMRGFIVTPGTGEIFANFYINNLTCIDDETAEIELTNSCDCVGKYIYIWHAYHSRPCFLIYNSQNTTICDATVRTHPGMAVTAQVSENITVKRLKVIPPVGEYVSTNTDATHIASCRGKLTLEDCMFVGMGDDGLNVHTYYMDIISFQGSSATVSIEPCDGTHAQLPCPPVVGDTFELLYKNSLEVKDRYILSAVEEIGFNKYKLTFDKSVADADDCCFADIDAVPNTTVRNCIFKNHFARGVLIKCRKALVENCYFDNISDSAIKIAPQAFWKEGIASEDVTIRGCKIVNCGWLEGICGGIYAYNESETRRTNVHKRITVENCTFENIPTERNIVIENTENVVIK